MQKGGLFRWIKESFNKDPLLAGIIALVCVVHLGALGWISYHSSFETPKVIKPNRSVLVKTVKLKEKEGTGQKHEKVIAVAPPPKVQAEKKKKVEPKKPEKKKEPPKPKPKEVKQSPKPKAKEKQPPKKEKKQIDSAKRKILQQVQESIAKIEERSDKLESSLKSDQNKASAAPSKVKGLSIEAKDSEGKSFYDKENVYSEELAARIRLSMKLPEFGAVDVALTLKRSGEVARIKIVKSESDRNKAYVESVLPTVTFAPFGKSFAKHETYTFHITLTNE